MKLRFVLFSLFSCLAFNQHTAHAECHGKVDVGAARIHMDHIMDGTKLNDFNLWGISGSGTVQVWNCIVARPAACWAEGDNTDYWSAGLGVGAFIPIPNYEEICFIPTVGGVYSEFDYRSDAGPFSNVFHSMDTWSAYAGLDVTWYVLPCLAVTGGVQHAWADSDTEIHLPTGNMANPSSSKGWNYQGQVDYYFQECWSFSVAGCYMSSRTRLKHGSDAVAIRSGFGYKF